VLDRIERRLVLLVGGCSDELVEELVVLRPVVKAGETDRSAFAPNVTR